MTDDKDEYADIRDKKVGPDGKCVLTGHPCTCTMKSLGHWCCWSAPRPTDSPREEKT
jgi:hypothetical protein